MLVLFSRSFSRIPESESQQTTSHRHITIRLRATGRQSRSPHPCATETAIGILQWPPGLTRGQLSGQASRCEYIRFSLKKEKEKRGKRRRREKRKSRKDSFAERSDRVHRLQGLQCQHVKRSRNHVQLRTLLERGVRSLSTQRSEGTSFLCWSMCGRYRQKVDHVLPAGADGFPSAHSWEGGSAGAPQRGLLTARSVNQPVRSA